MFTFESEIQTEGKALRLISHAVGDDSRSFATSTLLSEGRPVYSVAVNLLPGESRTIVTGFQHAQGAPHLIEVVRRGDIETLYVDGVESRQPNREDKPRRALGVGSPTIDGFDELVRQLSIAADEYMAGDRPLNVLASAKKRCWPCIAKCSAIAVGCIAACSALGPLAHVCAAGCAAAALDCKGDCNC